MGDASDCHRCLYCEQLMPSRAARNRHEDTVCEPVDADEERDDWDEAEEKDAPAEAGEQRGGSHGGESVR